MSTPLSPRVLLVDDEATVRQLVALALEDHPLRLQCCASVAEAQEALRAEPAALVITDLMMPGASGQVLLEWLQARPALRAGARLVVFSAGLDDTMRAQLAALDLWQLLPKPVSVLALQQCVQAALAAGPVAPPRRAAAPSAAPPAVTATATATPAVVAATAEQDAIARHFAGDRRLYEAYRAACLRQFPEDLRQADAALQRADLPALRRLAHSLKTVLASLGDAPGAAAARAAEQAAADGDARAAAAAWPGVAAALQRLRAGTHSAE